MAIARFCRALPALVWLAVLMAGAAPARAVAGDPLLYDPQVHQAYQHLHILEYDEALAEFQRIEEAHRDDPLAVALVLHAVLLRELYRQDLLDTTFYATDGFLSGRHPTPEDPQVRDQIFSLTDKVVDLANRRLKTNGRDTGALFARGWARSLKAAYMAMVERSFGSAFRQATQARSDEERVLQIDPGFADARLIVGIYQYVVGSLPLPFKIMIGFAGITGSKSRGMELLRDAASHGAITPVEAKTVMALFLRRDGKYREAIGVVQGLAAEYPRGFLFCLEEANLLKDAGEGQKAIETYRVLLAQKAGYFPSARPQLAWYGLGDSLRGQKDYSRAAGAYEQAAWRRGTGAELKRRALVSAGQMHDLSNERERAVRDYQAAIDAGSDTTQADLARKYLRSPYQGR